jgi:DNA-binding CsgD family transcriptional regulator
MSAGLALSLLVSLLLMWGGMPLHPYFGTGLDSVLKLWSVPHITAMAGGFLASAFIFTRPAFKQSVLMATLACVGLLGGFALMQLFGTSLHDVLKVVAATIMGVGSSLLIFAWMTLLPKLTNDEPARIMLLSICMSTAASLALAFITEALIPIIFVASALLGAATLILASHQLYFVEKNTEAFANAANSSIVQTVTPLPQILSAIRDPFLCMTALMFAIALTRSLALREILDYHTLTIASCLGTLAAAGVLYWLRFGFGGFFSIGRVFTMQRFYLLFFPIMATAFLLLSVFGSAIVVGVEMLAFMVYMLSLALLLPSATDFSREQKFPTPAVLGMLLGGSYLGCALATVLSLLVYYQNDLGAAAIPVGALLVVYVLAMVYTLLQKRSRQKIEHETLNKDANADNNEDLDAQKIPGDTHLSATLTTSLGETLRMPQKMQSETEQNQSQKDMVQSYKRTNLTATTTLNASGNSNDNSANASENSANAVYNSAKNSNENSTAANSAEATTQVTDVIASKCHEAALTYSLTKREELVLELLAHGRSVPAIASHLVISANTVRTHTKNIYVKLDVHSREEIIDIFG